MPESQRYADLGKPRRVWAVAAVRADVARLNGVHAALADRFRVGDRIVYLGDMIGHGDAVIETIDAVLAFRRWILAHRGAIPGDVAFLRGGQEEIWRGLLQLHFAPNPSEVLDWTLQNGARPVLAAYGGDEAQGFAAARGGAVALTRWTRTLRAAFYAQPGHEILFNTLRRAAHVGKPVETPINHASPTAGPLFVNAGADPSRPFTAQGDRFWWGGGAFHRIQSPFSGFARVVRGCDPAKGGPRVEQYAVTLDAGCGFGGPLVCAGFDCFGELIDSFQV